MQLTVRDVSDELGKRLEELSRARGQSVNATVLDLLSQAVGIEGRKARLKRYATWTADDLAEFEAVLRSQRVIDHELWR